MATFWRDDRVVRDTLGRAVPNASVYWCSQPTTSTSTVPPAPLASIASNSTGTSTTNPQVTDGFGHAAAYLTAGFYTVVVVWNGIVQQVYPDQAIGVQASNGTVSSVAFSAPSDIFAVSGSPVTTTGTLSVTEQTQSANKLWAGPTSGAAATPTFRSLVKADMPSGTLGNQQINLSSYVSSPRTGKFAMHCGQITATLTTLTLGSSDYGTFVSGDVGKTIIVEGAGASGGNLVTTIAGFTNSTTVTLTAAASTTTTIAIVAWYTATQDDTAALNSAMSALTPGTGVLYCPGDVYIITSAITASVNLSALIGDGISNTLFVFTASACFMTFNSAPVLGLTLGGSGSEGFTVLGPGTAAAGLVTNVALTTNVATFTQSNSYSAGQVVLVQGLTTTNGVLFNDIFYTVTGSTGTTWTGTGLTHADIPSTPDTGLANLDYTCFKFTGSASTVNGLDWVCTSNIEIHAFQGDGIQYGDNIVASHRDVKIWNMGGNGFNCLNISNNSAGTATAFDTTWCKACQKAGYYAQKLYYSSFKNTAADQCGIEYFMSKCAGLSFNGAGEESGVFRNAAYAGQGFVFDNCTSIVMSGCRTFVGSNFGNAASTKVVFRNSTRRFTMTNLMFDVGASPTLPTYLWSVDATCTAYWIQDPTYGTLASSAFQNLGTLGTYIHQGAFQSGSLVGVAPSFTSGVITDVLQVSNGTLFTAANITTPLDSKWGNTASIALTSGTVGQFAFNIACAGTGQGASPTVVIDLTALGLTQNPQPQISNRAAASSPWSLTSVSHTSMTLTYQGTPVAGNNYGAQVLVVSQG